jgi:hypothetical protein
MWVVVVVGVGVGGGGPGVYVSVFGSQSNQWRRVLCGWCCGGCAVHVGRHWRFAGELRGQITVDGYSMFSALSGAEQTPNQVASSASGLGSVAFLNSTAVSVTLVLTNIVNQTNAHLHAASAYTLVLSPSFVYQALSCALR